MWTAIDIPENWEEHIGAMSDSEIAEYLYNIVRNTSTPLEMPIDFKCNEYRDLPKRSCVSSEVYEHDKQKEQRNQLKSM